MNTAIASLLATALAFAGLGALSMAIDRHFEQLTLRREVPCCQRTLLRGLGSLLIALALAPCVWAWDASVGVVMWLGFLSVAALSLVLLLSYLPRVATLAAAMSAAAGVIGLGLLSTSRFHVL